MTKALSFVRLDYITVKPYFTIKNFLLFFAVALVMIITSDAAVSAISILMVYSTLYVSYPFAIGEQSGIDALYATLSIKRSTVVLGRYLFALAIDVCAGVIAYGFSFAALTILRKDFNASESLLVMVAMFFLYSVIQAIQLPVFFKLGYAKAKFLAYAPFIGLALATMFIMRILKDRFSPEQIGELLAWYNQYPHLAVLSGVVLWFGILFISYRLSVSYYGKREF